MSGCLLTALAALAAGAEVPDTDRPVRVAQIFVVGNASTPQSLYLDHLGLFPGQVLTDGALKDAAKNLSVLRLAGVRCTVAVIEETAGRPFQDLLVRAEESALTRVLFGRPGR